MYHVHCLSWVSSDPSDSLGTDSRIFDSESGRVTTMRFLQSRVSLITSTTDTMSMMSWLPGPSALTNTLLQVPPTAASSTTLESIFGAALRSYEKQTKCDIASHPLSTQIHFCDTPGAIIAVLRSQVQLSYQSQSASEKWTKWLVPIVHVLYAYSAALGNGEGLVNCETLSCFSLNLIRVTTDIPTFDCDFYRNWYSPASEHLP